jgi:signal transduction histidine kinase
LTLEITDDGAGFDPATPVPGHLGLHTMTERARAVGGSLNITSAPGAGTVVRVVVPAALRAAGPTTAPRMG